MTRSRTMGVTATAPHLASPILAFVLAIAFLIPGVAAHAGNDKGLSKEDKACLECHAKPGLDMTLADGKKLSLYIPAKAFAESTHNSSGCDGCHSEIDMKSHGTEKKIISGKREQSLALMDSCRDCHKKTVKQYEDSVHAALVQEGSQKAPLCSDCHNPHATRSAKDMAGHAEPVPCEKCHESIARAYTESVHGQAGDEALVCTDCHHTHNVKAASLGENLKNECLSCHRDAVAKHKVWLPNTERHLEAVSCPACHSPKAKRRVNLRLYDGVARQQVSEKVGVPQFVRMAQVADMDGAGLDGRALWSLLQDFNRSGEEGKMVLRGRLEVQTGVEAHQLAKKSQAIKDCDTCHREGAESFQSVSVTMAGPDGRPLRHDARKGVLNSAESLGSVGGFYAIGSTRIKLLDTLLILTLIAGIGIPVAHLAVKWLSNRARAKRAVAAARSAAQAKGQTSPDDRRPGGNTPN
ncbi:MAG TPA: hypothetical protein DEQ40_04695 [Oxalobacteraceae bacterium]|nr:hypothetical protein [Oxalobacteraceae bacterium]